MAAFIFLRKLMWIKFPIVLRPFARLLWYRSACLCLCCVRRPYDFSLSLRLCYS